MKRLFAILAGFAALAAVLIGPSALPASAAVNCTGCAVTGQNFKSGTVNTPWFLGGTVNKRASDRGCQWNTFNITRNNSNYYLLRVKWSDIDRSSGSSVVRATGDTGLFSTARTSYSTQPVQIWTSPHVDDNHGRWLTVTITYADIRDGIQKTASATLKASNP